MIELPYSIAGFVVGAIVGLTGVGGGSLMTPLLVLGFGVAPVTAVGTDLLYAGITKAAGTAAHGWKGHIDWRIAGWLAAGSVPATALGLFLLSALPPAGATTRVIVSMTLGAMLVATALAIALRARLLQWARARQSSWIAKHAIAATVATGALLGFAVTLSSVGAGAVGVTALALLYPALATVRIVGTDIAHAIPIALLAGAGHALLGNVDLALLASLLAGSIPGILLGSLAAARLPERLLRHSLVAVLLFAGTKLVLH